MCKYFCVNSEDIVQIVDIGRPAKRAAAGGQPRTRDMMGPINIDTEQQLCCDCVVDTVAVAIMTARVQTMRVW